MIEGEPVETLLHETLMSEGSLLVTEDEAGRVQAFIVPGIVNEEDMTYATVINPFPAFDAMAQLCEICGTSFQMWDKAIEIEARLGGKDV